MIMNGFEGSIRESVGKTAAAHVYPVMAWDF